MPQPEHVGGAGEVITTQAADPGVSKLPFLHRDAGSTRRAFTTPSHSLRCSPAPEPARNTAEVVAIAGYGESAAPGATPDTPGTPTVDDEALVALTGAAATGVGAKPTTTVPLSESNRVLKAVRRAVWVVSRSAVT